MKGTVTMPRGKAPKKPQTSYQKKKKKPTWGGYINVPLGAEERQGFTVWLEKESPDIEKLLLSFVDADMNFTLTFDHANSSYVAKLTAINEKENATYQLTAFHSGIAECIYLLAYKHFAILLEDWFADNEDKAEFLEWG